MRLTLRLGGVNGVNQLGNAGIVISGKREGIMISGVQIIIFTCLPAIEMYPFQRPGIVGAALMGVAVAAVDEHAVSGQQFRAITVVTNRSAAFDDHQAQERIQRGALADVRTQAGKCSGLLNIQIMPKRVI